MDPLGDGVRSARRTALNACASFRSVSISLAVWHGFGQHFLGAQHRIRTVFTLFFSFVKLTDRVLVLTE